MTSTDSAALTRIAALRAVHDRLRNAVTPLTPAQFRDLIGRGCAKVNISTALKETFMKSGLDFLRETAERDKWDPPSLFRHQRAAVSEMARRHIRLFGGSGRAW